MLKVILKYLFFLFPLVSFFSCSDSAIRMDSSEYAVIFDYENETDKPSVFLSVAVKLGSKVQRVSSVTIKNKESGFIWQAFNPDFQGTAESGSVYLKCSPSGFDGLLPEGLYSYTVTNINGEEAENFFTVEYDEKFMQMNCGEIQTFFDSSEQPENAIYSATSPKAENAVKFANASKQENVSAGNLKIKKYYALFSQNGDLLYYVNQQKNKNQKLTKESVFADYRDVSYFRPCYVNSNETVVFLMPAVSAVRK
ncbi:MAG: hypothetical protein K5640_00625 [Treponema sp.]|nr:hypothetical protein [Treponema sp.]